ncbi:hypothetical protein E4U53_007446 [Claviceps sorghi]|nr:hypothetical protein E4U53_007446 [Claviceps sorghi]
MYITAPQSHHLESDPNEPPPAAGQSTGPDGKVLSGHLNRARTSKTDKSDRIQLRSSPAIMPDSDAQNHENRSAHVGNIGGRPCRIRLSIPTWDKPVKRVDKTKSMFEGQPP